MDSGPKYCWHNTIVVYYRPLHRLFRKTYFPVCIRCDWQGAEFTNKADALESSELINSDRY